MRNLTLLLVAATIAAFASSCSSTQPGPTPTTLPHAASHPNALRQLAATETHLAEPVVRVGLSSDQVAATFPRVGSGYEIKTSDGTFSILRGFTVHAPVGVAKVRYAIQVAAISDRGSAEKLAERAKTDTGLRADFAFDTASTTYKVLVGEFESELSAQPAKSNLAARGYPKEMFVVRRPSEQPFDEVLRLLDDEGDERRFRSKSLLVIPLLSETIAIAGKQYRGGARIVLNSRGTLNLVNELNLEDYVKGVVPNEMGPSVFDAVEALEAQAIAARTYVVARRGEYAAEGYDICATPSCQVYGGFSTEHQLSNRAVDASAGLVITYDGKPIDALYTSTCGGETSDVGVMFPGRTEPYLRRARCVEADIAELEGRRDGSVVDDAGFRAEVLRTVAFKGEAMASVWSASEIARAVEASGALAGITPRSTSLPRSSRRRDVLRYLGEVWGLEEAARVLLLPEDREYLAPHANEAQTRVSVPHEGAQTRVSVPHEGDAADIASLAVKFEAATLLALDAKDLDAAMPRDELFALLYGWLKQLGTFNETSGTLTVATGRRVTIRGKDRETNTIYPPGTPVFRRLNDRYREGAAVAAQPGDRATLVQRGSQVVAVVVQANYDGAAFDQRSSYSSWVRSLRADELAASIAKRNPLVKLEGLRVLGRDASQRITQLEVTAEGGRTFALEGLPIRCSLGVPDNLFVFEVTRDADGMQRYTFFGKGWGHGTGFCQNGAYGMALRGWEAEEILKRYYTGVTIAPMTAVAAR